MNKIRDYLEQICYLLNKRLWDYYAKRSTIKGIVLMYHHVTDDIPNSNYSSYCKIEVFRKTIIKYINAGYKIVDIDQAIDIIQSKDGTPFVVVTFDDVPLDFYENAYPILKELKIPFTLFVAKCFMEKEGYLSEGLIKQLDQDNLCTIGAHTLTHPMLRKSNCMDEELKGSKKYLETMLGHEINYLAYPYGRRSSVSNTVMKKAEQAGFKCAFGTIQSYISDGCSKNLYYLPRMVKNRDEYIDNSNS